MRAALVLLAALTGCGQLLGISDPVAGSLSDGSVDGARGDAGPIDATIDAPSLIDAPAGSISLRVKNYLSWCSVSVNGGGASTSAEQMVLVPAGTQVPVSAVAVTGFQLGTAPWHDTDGDSGSGEAGTVTGTGQSASSATTETVGVASDCVWVCCEFSGGGGCPASEQCP